jgi:hypothetical protein
MQELRQQVHLVPEADITSAGKQLSAPPNVEHANLLNSRVATFGSKSPKLAMLDCARNMAIGAPIVAAPHNCKRSWRFDTIFGIHLIIASPFHNLLP